MKTLLVSSILVLAVAACGGSTGASGGPASVAPATPPASAGVPSPAPSTSGETAASPAPTESPAQGPAADATPVIVKDFTIDPIEVTLTGPVSLAVSNAGPTVHNLSIRDAADELLAKTEDLREGESETLEVDLADGDYVLFCSLPGHESLGMRGTLTVGP
jgi:plastocyanin